MGLLDFNPNLDDPKTVALIEMGLSLLSPSQTKMNTVGKIGQAGMQGLQGYATTRQAQMQQQAMERANRASDLQEALGVQGALQQNELPLMIDAYNSGKPYTPSAGMQ